MEIVSINVGNRERLKLGNGLTITTGINKKPVPTAEIGELGVAGDAVCNARHHGGPDQAVYLYRQEDYDYWSEEIGKEVLPGTFGDNLTILGLPEPCLNVGDELVFPDLVLQATAPRIPCSILAATMKDKFFPKKFTRAARPGIYCRVLKTGSIAVGDKFEVNPFTGDLISTTRFFNDWHRQLSGPEIRRYLDIPIGINARSNLEERLARSKS